MIYKTVEYCKQKILTFILSIGIELGSSLSSPLVHKTKVKIITLSPPQFEVNLLSVTNIKHGIC
jgi:hypothetical protein